MKDPHELLEAEGREKHRHEQYEKPCIDHFWDRHDECSYQPTHAG